MIEIQTDNKFITWLILDIFILTLCSFQALSVLSITLRKYSTCHSHLPSPFLLAILKMYNFHQTLKIAASSTEQLVLKHIGTNITLSSIFSDIVYPFVHSATSNHEENSFHDSRKKGHVHVQKMAMMVFVI